jgi:hypothetical protein
MPGKVTPHDCRVSVSAAVIDLDHRMPAAHDNTRALKQADSFVYVMVRLERGPRRERSWRLLQKSHPNFVRFHADFNGELFPQALQPLRVFES